MEFRKVSFTYNIFPTYFKYVDLTVVAVLLLGSHCSGLSFNALLILQTILAAKEILNYSSSTDTFTVGTCLISKYQYIVYASA